MHLKKSWWKSSASWTDVTGKGVGPGMTLAWPGWKQSDIAVEVDRGDSKHAGSKNVVQTVHYPTSLVLNSRVLLMYTDTVEELPGYPVQNSPSGSFLFWGGSVGRGGLVYDIVRMGWPRRTPCGQPAYTCMLSYSIVVFHLSFNFLCLLLLHSIYLCGNRTTISGIRVSKKFPTFLQKISNFFGRFSQM